MLLMCNFIHINSPKILKSVEGSVAYMKCDHLGNSCALPLYHQLYHGRLHFPIDHKTNKKRIQTSVTRY